MLLYSLLGVDGVDLEVRQGEFVTLLGPSGSGKTTTLRLIAGLLPQSRGTIEIDGLDMSRVPPHRRDLGMIFQNYALFPHLTAARNIAFPLEMRRVRRPEIKRRVAEALTLVKLEGLAERYPRQLSGGQQQRIALARAVVFNPHLLLMDEPLGALDKKLRDALQLELIHISRQIGATVVYVTHDQEEALILSDRIAIFRKGRIEQLGTGADLYDRPVSLFVADFIGESNIFRGLFDQEGEGGRLVRDPWRWRVGAAATARASLPVHAAAALVVRPERLHVSDITAQFEETGDVNSMEAVVKDVLYLGSMLQYEFLLPDGETARVRQQVGESGTQYPRGSKVRLLWAVDDAVLVPDSALSSADDGQLADSARP